MRGQATLAAVCPARYAAGMSLCGIDEAGRGPLAGPVTAAAVVLPPDYPDEGLADSKALTSEQREEMNALLRGGLVCWGLGWAWPDEIDRLNIHHATLLAMQRAFFALIGEPDCAQPLHTIDMPNSVHATRGGPVPETLPEKAVVDGRHTPELPVPAEAIVKGDRTVAPIQAASILAKVARDSWMCDYAAREPHYLFHKHKGYPTAEHRRLLREHGPSRIHRHSFRSA